MEWTRPAGCNQVMPGKKNIRLWYKSCETWTTLQSSTQTTACKPLKSLATFLLASIPGAAFSPSSVLCFPLISPAWLARAPDFCPRHKYLPPRQPRSALVVNSAVAVLERVSAPPPAPPPPRYGGGGGNGSEGGDDYLYLRPLDPAEQADVLDDWVGRTRVYRLEDSFEIGNKKLGQKHTKMLTTLEAVRAFNTSQTTEQGNRSLLGLSDKRQSLTALAGVYQSNTTLVVSHLVVYPAKLNDDEELAATVTTMAHALHRYAILDVKLPLTMESNLIQNIIGEQVSAFSQDYGDCTDGYFTDEYQYWWDDDDNLYYLYYDDGIERRMDPDDGGIYSEEEFREYYEDQWQKHWDSAMILAERRIDANDGGAFTEQEFRDYYGDEFQKHWDRAERFMISTDKTWQLAEQSDMFDIQAFALEHPVRLALSLILFLCVPGLLAYEMSNGVL